MTEQPPPTPPTPTPPTPERRMFPVVTLMRDEVTGELALQVGSRVYSDANTLRDSPDWTRVEYAARDLALWVDTGSSPPRRTEERRPEDRRTEESPRAGSMIEQINRILEAKLASEPPSVRAVRLAEGPGGSVRVYIGVEPYAVDEVPNPVVRSAIREAVAEWEASR